MTDPKIECALPVYMDNSATTRVDPRVLAKMLPFFSEHYGNAASRNHVFGWTAEAAVEAAREQVALLIGATAKEILWTSGSTESNNLAIKGAAEMYRQKGRHFVTCVTEHKAVLDTMKHLETEGAEVTYLPVDRQGHIDLAQLASVLTERTVLVSLMAANNETGTVHPMAEIGKLCKQKGVLFHCDATQASGRLALDVEALGIDLLSLSAHKFYGPKGVGALYVRRLPRIALEPQVAGGGQERGLRGGTLNVPGIVGFGAAAALARTALPSEGPRVAALRDRLLAQLQTALDGVTVNGSLTHRLPHNLHVSVAGVDGEALMTALADEVAVSSGSACASGSREPSHVMVALGHAPSDSWGALRFGLGRGTAAADIDAAAACVAARVTQLRAMSPVGTGARA